MVFCALNVIAPVIALKPLVSSSAFLMACSLYPEAVGKIYWAKSLHSRQRARILAALYKEYDLVPLMFCGEDLCNNKGPMVSPAFLRQHYFRTVRMIIEPLFPKVGESLMMAPL